MLGDQISISKTSLPNLVDASIPFPTHENLLPPYIGTPTSQAQQSPYHTSAKQIILRYGTSPRRLEILRRWNEFRQALFRSNIRQGFQWIDGSFTEGKNDNPKDIDIVTFFDTQGLTQEKLVQKLHLNGIDIIDHDGIKTRFLCDAYWVCLNIEPQQLIGQSIFWLGLFTHTRNNTWKGILQIPLASSQADIDLCHELIKHKKEPC